MEKLFPFRKTVKLDKTASTNTYVSENVKDLPNGSVVWTTKQTDGRGQVGNKWESESGMNLTFSMFLQPNFLKAAEQFYLSKIVSLAVADYVALYTDKVSVKWPNDIYVGDFKIAGILIENSIVQSSISESIVGIGININQKEFVNAPNAISLTQLSGDVYDIEELLEIMIEILDYRYEMLKMREFDDIDENYSDLLYRKDTMSDFLVEGKPLKAKINGVKSSGELLLTDSAGKKHEYLFKEIEYVI